jgi:hypothetical protein
MNNSVKTVNAKILEAIDAIEANPEMEECILNDIRRLTSEKLEIKAQAKIESLREAIKND